MQLPHRKASTHLALHCLHLESLFHVFLNLCSSSKVLASLNQIVQPLLHGLGLNVCYREGKGLEIGPSVDKLSHVFSLQPTGRPGVQSHLC